MTLTNKRILLGVTGSIAAYKSADIARRLRDAGSTVRVAMTQGATEFITPLTLQAVSGRPVHQHLLDTEAEAAMGHIELARWADAVLVAPASANFLARLAHGRADDLLSAVCLATAAPVAVAPAMNRQMWDNPATQANLVALRRRGIKVFGPGEGAQACGETGPGRLLETAELVRLLSESFATGGLDGLTVVVTAGPTWEVIDPVRGLTNRSSGKMGYAVAEAAAEAGAKVILISGPTALPDPERVQTLRVTSAREMFEAVHTHIHGAHIFIGVAAVADYRPAHAENKKIKKRADTFTMELVKNPDILASVAALEHAPFVVGFAAETEDLEQNARKKLKEKNLDLIAANRVGVPGGGFESDTNSLLLIDREGVVELPAQSDVHGRTSVARGRMPIATKTQLARELIKQVSGRYHAKNRTKNTRQAHRQ